MYFCIASTVSELEVWHIKSEQWCIVYEKTYGFGIRTELSVEMLLMLIYTTTCMQAKLLGSVFVWSEIAWVETEKN